MNVEDQHTWDLLMQRFDEIDRVQSQILDQTLRTNGRVSALEHWMWFVKGAIGVILLAGGYFAVRVFEHVWGGKG